MFLQHDMLQHMYLLGTLKHSDTSNLAWEHNWGAQCNQPSELQFKDINTENNLRT